jgi:hypothetical protein
MELRVSCKGPPSSTKHHNEAPNRTYTVVVAPCLGQLTSERGHLRNVTEKSLQEDVVAGKELPEDTEGDSEEKTEKKDKKDAPTKEERLQEVIRMHQEMSSHME